MRFHESDLIYMRGSGTGKLFSSVFKALRPFAAKGLPFLKAVGRVGKRVATSAAAKKALKAAKKTALETGLDVAHDVLKGQDLEESIANNMQGTPITFAKYMLKGGAVRRGRKGKTARKPRRKAGRGGGRSTRRVTRIKRTRRAVKKTRTVRGGGKRRGKTSRRATGKKLKQRDFFKTWM